MVTNEAEVVYTDALLERTIVSTEHALLVPSPSNGPRRSGSGSVMDSNATVPKAVGLIQVKEQAGNLAAQDQKVLNVFLYHSLDEMLDVNAVHKVDMQEIRRYLGRHESNDQVRKSVKTLTQVILNFDVLDTDGNRKWGSGSLLTASGYESGDEGVIEYQWPHWLRPLLAEPAKWARLSMTVVRSFRSKYGIRLYENLEIIANRDVKEWVVSAEELRVLLGVPSGKLEGWGAFYRRALQPALDEVNELADFHADWRVYRQRGRKVVSVQFTVKKTWDREQREYNGRANRAMRRGIIVLKHETIEKAKQLAPGADVYRIEAEWKAFSEGKPRPRNADAAFLGFVKQWEKNRQGRLAL